MKLLVLSDIHANIWALQAVLERETNWDHLFIAGDLVDYGIAPKETIEWVRSIPEGKKTVVQGNHDLHAVRVRDSEDYRHMPPERYKWIHYNLMRMSGEQVEYLKNLPRFLAWEADGWAYVTAHSYQDSYQMIESRFQFDEFWRKHTPRELQDAPKRRVIFGHTHRQCIHILGDGVEWLNPGSVSYRRPDDPDKTAHYAVIQDGCIRLCQTPYDRSPQKEEALRFLRSRGMMKTEIQDFLFFFGDAPTSRSEIWED